MIGGGVALAVSSLLFPTDPALHVARAAQAVFAGLGCALERLATALDRATPARARGAGRGARARPLLGEFNEALETGRETARLSPRRRTANAALERYAESFTEVDFAIRDTRVLARHSVRLLRAQEAVPETLPDAVRELGVAVWTLASAYDQPERADEVRGHALRAGSLAQEGPTEVLAQIRSTAVDLRRAADLTLDPGVERLEAPTEELLATV